jgi:hypothetical protein
MDKTTAAGLSVSPFIRASLRHVYRNINRSATQSTSFFLDETMFNDETAWWTSDCDPFGQ